MLALLVFLKAKHAKWIYFRDKIPKSQVVSAEGLKGPF